MQFPCGRCGRTYEIADELCLGRAVKVACPACGNLAVHRPASPAPAPPPAPPAPIGVPPSFAQADEDDFDNALSALDAPWSEPAEPAPPPEAPAPLPDAPVPRATPPSPAAAPAAAPPAAAKPPAKPPVKPASKPATKPTQRPAPPPTSLEDEEPVMVTAELVIRRSARRTRIVTAAAAIVLVAAGVGGAGFAMRWKRAGPVAGGGGAKRTVEGDATSAAGLSADEIAKLMGRVPEGAPGAGRPAPRAAAPAADRPKHEKLALKDRELLDLLNRKGDAAVTVQGEDAMALATTRGSLDEQAIEGTLSRNSGSFMACVTRAIQSSPDQRLPATKVMLELTIRPSGRVAKAGVREEAVAKLPLGACIAQAAKRMVFPGFDGEPLDIVVPLKLKVGL